MLPVVETYRHVQQSRLRATVTIPLASVPQVGRVNLQQVALRQAIWHVFAQTSAMPRPARLISHAEATFLHVQR